MRPGRWPPKCAGATTIIIGAITGTGITGIGVITTGIIAIGTIATGNIRRDAGAFIRFDRIETGLWIFELTRFPDANRFPPPDQVWGHASLENALLCVSEIETGPRRGPVVTWWSILHENVAMKRWIGAAIMAAGLALSGPVATGSAAAANSEVGLHAAGLHGTDASKATDLGARRRVRHYRRDAYRAYDRPRYYDRPYDYRPYPYAAPVPFFLGFGFGPSW
jgi:hypothetical protein